MSTEIYHGIPTLYRGVRMRSRLEARWARFFDALGWGWQYEPLDLAGYIPDFVLRLDAGPLLVEVKPAVELSALDEHRDKIQRSGWAHEALIVGADLFEIDHVHPVLGQLGEREPGPDDELEWSWGAARLFRCLSCGQVSLLAESGSWRCRVCGAAEDHLGGLSSVADTWAEAGNRVQWRAGA